MERPASLRGGPAAKLKEQEATASNVNSPKGISKKKPSSGQSLGQQRRRLSVVSDSKLVEGMAQMLNDEVGGDAALAEGEARSASMIASYAGISKKGYAPYNPRKKNQDSLVMAEDVATGSLLLCVFDGHGEAGDGVSQFFKAHMSKKLFTHAKFAPTGNPDTDCENIKAAIEECLNELEQKLLRDASIDTEFSGTTAVVSVVRGNKVIVGNVGDSRISRGYSEGPQSPVLAQQISDDHKPDRPDEKERILGVGGRVFAVEYDDGIDGPPRVWLGHMDVPGLAMSRSLGDTVAHTAGVSSKPEFFVHTLGPEDKYLVLATDGLWEFMSDQEVLDIVAKENEPRKAVDVLIMEANNRWMKEEQVIDDTTVIVATVNA